RASSYQKDSAFHYTPPDAELPTLSLHDALPISAQATAGPRQTRQDHRAPREGDRTHDERHRAAGPGGVRKGDRRREPVHDARHRDRKSTRLNSSHEWISYAVFCLKKKNTQQKRL